MTDDNRTFTRGEGVPDHTFPTDTLFGLPVVVNPNIPKGKIQLVMSDWDEWIQYRWRDVDGKWHTQWGSR